jgi:hypothetical protein
LGFNHDNPEKSCHPVKNNGSVFIAHGTHGIHGKKIFAFSFFCVFRVFRGQFYWFGSG